jgi:AAA+ superfamily predicted ATPase
VEHRHTNRDDHVIAEASKVKSSRKHRGGIILLVDEADALAQSRESTQMHHEDRAGVNAFIRGIDRIARQKLPAAVLMCSNRLSALDPAVRRRAAAVLLFERPNDDQRRALLSNAVDGLNIETTDLERLVRATGPTTTRNYGFTFSDITQRLIPALVLDAYPDGPITAHRAIAIAKGMLPTPPFRDN